MKRLIFILFVLISFLSRGQQPMFFGHNRGTSGTGYDCRIVAVPYSGTANIFYSTNGGTSWSEKTPIGSTNNMFSTTLRGDRATVTRLGATPARFEYTLNSFTTLTQHATSRTHRLGGDISKDGQVIVELNSGSTVEISTNGGTSWGTENTGVTVPYGCGISGTGDTIIIGSQTTTTSRRSVSGTWSNLSIGATVYDLDISADGTKIFCGIYGGNVNEVFVSTNSGSSFTGYDLNTGTAVNVRAKCSDSGVYVLVHIPGKTWVSNDSGSTWTEVLTGTSTEYISWSKCVSGSGQFMVMGDSGTNKTYHISGDYGVTWETVELPGFPVYTIRGIAVQDNLWL